MSNSRFRRILTAGSAVVVSAGIALGAASGIAGALTPWDAVSNLSSTFTSSSSLFTDNSTKPGGTNEAKNLVLAKDVRVIDGDTLEVSYNSERVSVRLIGIDTPETKHPDRPAEKWGPEATANAEKLIKESGSSDVLLEFDKSQGDRDKYDRLLAYAWTINPKTNEAKAMINLSQLEAGLAEEYTYGADYRYKSDFKVAEKAAQDARLGLWG